MLMCSGNCKPFESSVLVSLLNVKEVQLFFSFQFRKHLEECVYISELTGSFLTVLFASAFIPLLERENNLFGKTWLEFSK